MGVERPSGAASAVPLRYCGPLSTGDAHPLLRIGVCAKATPDPTAVNELARSGHLYCGDSGEIRLGGVPYGIHDFDLGAVRAAVSLSKGIQPSEVVVVSVDPTRRAGLFERAFELGADRGLHISSGRDGTGPGAVAALLAAVARRERIDVLLCGRSASDTADGGMGGRLAALLDRPCVGAAADIGWVSPSSIGARRRSEDGRLLEIVADLPAVVTVNDDRWGVPWLRADDVLAARHKRPEVLDADALGVRPEQLDTPHELATIDLSVAHPQPGCEPISPSSAADAARTILRMVGAGLRP